MTRRCVRIRRVYCGLAGTRWSLISLQAHSATRTDRKSTRLNSSHTVIYTLSLHDALPIYSLNDEKVRANPPRLLWIGRNSVEFDLVAGALRDENRSEEHTSELQSHSDLHSFPTRRSSDLFSE